MPPTLRCRFAVAALLCVAALGCRRSGQTADAGQHRTAGVGSGKTARPVDSHTPIPPHAHTQADSLFAAYEGINLRTLRPDTSGAARWVDSLMAALSLREKIGQLFIVRLREPTARGSLSEAAAAAVEQGVGGFIIPRTIGPRTVHRQVRLLQRRAEVPLFIAADYERGAGRFSNNFTELPSNMALGAARSPALAAAAGRLTAIESRAAGVNLLFAPVVDVNNNPENPIINIRSYGENPRLVGRMGRAFVRAAEAFGLLTTLKHFPGHGNTSVDSHVRLGVVSSTHAELDSIELKPYRMILGAAGPAAVMTAHLWVKALDDGPIPATFSRDVLAGLLREVLAFDGLVVTDDIGMGALRDRYADAARIVRPLRAGADVILMPNDLPAAIQIVKEAAADGRLSVERINRTMRRILEAKAAAGLHHRRVQSEAVLDRLLKRPRGRAVAQTIADRALTLLATAPVLPLPAEAHTLLVQLSNYEGSESIAAAMDAFAVALADEGRPLESRRYDLTPSAAERGEAVAAARAAEVVVLALYLRLTAGRGAVGLYSQQARLVHALLAQDTPVVLAVFGNPYAVSAFMAADAQLVAYDQTIASIRAAARILEGKQPPRGRLPVTAAPYAYGSGLQALRPDTSRRAAR